MSDKDFQTKKALSELIELRNTWYAKWNHEIKIRKFFKPYIGTKEGTIENPEDDQLYIDIDMLDINEDQ